MTPATPADDLKALYPRLLFFGVPYPDLAAAAIDPGTWGRTLAARAAVYAMAAAAAAGRRQRASARELWLRAAVCFHYAQLRLPLGEEKEMLRGRCRTCFRQAAAGLAPPAEPLPVRFRGGELPGYVRIARPGAPCVVLIGGLDSAKEVELRRFGEVFLERGLSVAFFDGPGQGELLGRVPLAAPFESGVAALLDALAADPRVDAGRFGIFGVSFGGHLACRASATDPRLRACVSLGGFFDGAILARLPAVALETVRRSFGLGDGESFDGVAGELSLAPLRGAMDRPLLVVHGERDHLVDLSQAEAMAAWAGERGELWSLDAEHVCTDRFSEVLPRLGDWMAARLGLDAAAADLPARPVELIDLSVTIAAIDSERVPPVIRYVDHGAGARQMGEIFGIPADRLPDGLGWAGEEVTLLTHAGTHMDAPWHYGPTCGGRPARRIDEVPLDWCIGAGLVLDMTGKPDGEAILCGDLEAACRRIGRQPARGDIVLIRTGAAAYWGLPEYPDRGTGLSREATLWLLDRGVRVIGTDAWGLDPPFPAMRREYQRTGEVDRIWAAHFAGRDREYCQLEKLANLHLLPPAGFTVICFPVKVARASAGWSRVVALVGGREAMLG